MKELNDLVSDSNPILRIMDKLDTINGYIKNLDQSYIKELDDKFEEELNQISKSQGEIESELKNAYKNEDLVFVFGAGISKDFGLPDWNVLLQKLILKSVKVDGNNSYAKASVFAQLFQQLFNLSPLITARYLKNYFGKNHNIKFEDEIRKALYNSYKSNHQSKLMDEILQFCVAPGKAPNLNSIITYNYDDILEEYLSKQNIKIPFKTIYKIGSKPQNKELAIYHIHGYLPRKGKVDLSLNITLSEDAYHKQYNDIYSWNNIIQINKFKDNTCLFIGVSLTDPNLRRVLDIAKMHRGDNQTPHFIIKKRHNSKILSVYLKSFLQQNKNIYNEKVMADLMLTETSEYLSSMMEKYEEADALSFGINTIWVDKYEDIPQILKSIRE